MRVDQFDFQLPDACIALRPLEKRDDARMLKVGAGGSLDDLQVSDLPDCLRPGDALVFNDTRVIPAQLDGVRERGGNQAALSATLHLRLDSHRWWAFIRNAKRVRQGDTLRFRSADGQSELEAHVEETRDGGEALLAFASMGKALDRDIERTGAMPIPPYIASRRAVDAGDESAYQTIYAQAPGAVAAPTAGLHFTEDLMARLKDREIGLHYLTLHVGAGTFLPVKADDTADHRMHAERGVIDAATADRLNAVREAGGRLICVGTTSMRLVESAADETGTIAPFAGTTDIFITPGYRFRACDGLLTNFHLPRSTLFMLVSAFSGLETMRRAYAHAIDHGYRFYSYGDACLLEPAGR